MPLHSKKSNNSTPGNCICGFTSDTENALHHTLNDNFNFGPLSPLYAMPGFIQSNRIESEFIILRVSRGGNYYVSAEQVGSALQLQ